MPDGNELLGRGKFLKLCAAGAIGLAVTFAAACGEEDEDEEDDGEDDGEEDGGGGLY